MQLGLSEVLIRRVGLRVIGAVLFFTPFCVAIADATINKDADNVAIGGYDTVAYFTEGKAVKGKADFALVWQDARWLFSSGAHREQFAATPERYAPQFGGMCAGAMTRGVIVKADPEAWTIVDGKLYIKVNKEARDRWREDPQENVTNANEAWSHMNGQD